MRDPNPNLTLTLTLTLILTLTLTLGAHTGPAAQEAQTPGEAVVRRGRGEHGRHTSATHHLGLRPALTLTQAQTLTLALTQTQTLTRSTPSAG